MNADRIINHRLVNLLHTFLLFSGMVLLLAAIGLSLAGVRGLLWALVLGTAMLLFSQGIPPHLMMSMYGSRPLSLEAAPGLYRIATGLAKRANLKAVPRLYLIPSRMANAVTVGHGDQAAIGLTDALLRSLNARELAGVLAHEISHIRHNDLRVRLLADAISRITGLFAFFGRILLFLNLPLMLMGRGTISWLAILLLIIAPVLSGLLQMALSRTREFDADLGAVRLTGDPEGLASALQKMETYQESLLRRLFLTGYRLPDPTLLRTHPRTGERVRRLLDLRGSGPQREIPGLDAIPYVWRESYPGRPGPGRTILGFRS